MLYVTVLGVCVWVSLLVCGTTWQCISNYLRHLNPLGQTSLLKGNPDVTDIIKHLQVHAYRVHVVQTEKHIFKIISAGVFNNIFTPLKHCHFWILTNTITMYNMVSFLHWKAFFCWWVKKPQFHQCFKVITLTWHTDVMFMLTMVSMNWNKKNMSISTTYIVCLCIYLYISLFRNAPFSNNYMGKVSNIV